MRRPTQREALLISAIPDPWKLSQELADVFIAYVAAGGQVSVIIDSEDASLLLRVTDPLFVARFIERAEEMEKQQDSEVRSE
jgi:hypothetical protein